MKKTRMLLTGASSYVGARLFLEFQRDYDVVGTYSAHKLHPSFLHLDTTVPADVEATVTKVKPDVIVHVAANANARWCEANEKEAVALNETATGSMVAAANAIKARMIYLSSYAAMHPTNVYGRTKRRSEELAKKTQAGWVVLRPSLILGFSPNTVNDRPFNRLLRNLDGGVPAVYDTSWHFEPTYILHIADMITAVIRKRVTALTIPVACPTLTTRYQTARDILSPFGIQVSGVDKKEVMETARADMTVPDGLDLPRCTYEQMIEGIIQEIRTRERFVFPPVT